MVTSEISCTHTIYFIQLEAFTQPLCPLVLTIYSELNCCAESLLNNSCLVMVFVSSVVLQLCLVHFIQKYISMKIWQ